METSSGENKNIYAPHQVVENYRAQLTATKTLYNGNILVKEDLEWIDAIKVPEKKTFVITNFWLHAPGALVTETTVDVLFRHRYPGGDWVIFWGYRLRAQDELGGPNHHETGAKVLEAGSELQISATSTLFFAYVGITLDGGEISQT